MFFGTNISIARKTWSVAYGIFWGIFPLWGFQLAIGLPTAALLRLHVPLVFLAANISIPPMIPFILYGSFWTGALVLGGNQGDLSWESMGNLDVIKTNVYQYTLGAIVLSIIAALIAALATYLFLSLSKHSTRAT
ncbi:MAG: DUF2062 domain-containing protein [Aureispira sp.]